MIWLFSNPQEHIPNSCKLSKVTVDLNVKVIMPLRFPRSITESMKTFPVQEILHLEPIHLERIFLY